MDFWDQFLRLDFHGAPRCSWERLGKQIRLLESVLVPVGRIAKRLACPKCGCNHRVFPGDTEDRVRAVCQCEDATCGDLDLPKSSVEMLAVDLRKLPKLLGAHLPMEPRLFPSNHAPFKAWRLGMIHLRPNGRPGSLVACFSAKDLDLNNAALGVGHKDLDPTIFVCRTERADQLEAILPSESRVVDFDCFWSLGADGFRPGKSARQILSGWDDELPPSQPMQADGKFVFRASGSVWVVVFDGRESFHIKDGLGARYIDYLLHHPNVPISSFDLEVAVSPGKAKARGESSIQVNADPETIRSYLRNLDSLRAKREAAAEEGRQVQVSRLDDDIEKLEKAVKEAGSQGAGDRGERSRHNVRKAITAVKDKLLKSEQPAEKKFGRHLQDMLSTGYDCSYKSPSGRIWR